MNRLARRENSTYILGVEVVMVAEQLDVVGIVQVGGAELLEQLFLGADAVRENVEAIASGQRTQSERMN